MIFVFAVCAPHRTIPKHQISTQHKPRRSMPQSNKVRFRLEKNNMLLNQNKTTHKPRWTMKKTTLPFPLNPGSFIGIIPQQNPKQLEFSAKPQVFSILSNLTNLSSPTWLVAPTLCLRGGLELDGTEEGISGLQQTAVRDPMRAPFWICGGNPTKHHQTRLFGKDLTYQHLGTACFLVWLDIFFLRLEGEKMVIPFFFFIGSVKIQWQKLLFSSCPISQACFQRFFTKRTEPGCRVDSIEQMEIVGTGATEPILYTAYTKT